MINIKEYLEHLAISDEARTSLNDHAKLLNKAGILEERVEELAVKPAVLTKSELQEEHPLNRFNTSVLALPYSLKGYVEDAIRKETSLAKLSILSQQSLEELMKIFPNDARRKGELLQSRLRKFQEFINEDPYRKVNAKIFDQWLGKDKIEIMDQARKISKLIGSKIDGNTPLSSLYKGYFRAEEKRELNQKWFAVITDRCIPQEKKYISSVLSRSYIAGLRTVEDLRTITIEELVNRSKKTRSLRPLNEQQAAVVKALFEPSQDDSTEVQ